MTLEELKEWICNNGYHQDTGKFSPGMAKRVEKNLTIKETILQNSPNVVIGAKKEKEPFICERILYIMNGLTEQKKCFCGTPIHIKRDTCSYKCLTNSPEIKAKREKTCIERYGTTNPSHSQVVKDKIAKKTAANAETSLVKRKQTNLERYGVEFHFQSEEFKIKAQQTTMERYGVDNVFRNPEFIKTNMELRNNRSLEELEKINIKCTRSKFKNNFNSKRYYHYEGLTPLFTEDDWELPITERKYLCNICGKEFKRFSDAITRCIHCHPVNTFKSEHEIFQFVSDVYFDEIKHPDRTQIRPQELDIYIPDLKLAIEYDGFLSHTYGTGITSGWKRINNLDKENMYYHLNKTLKCKEKGIELLHVFSHEWTLKYKREIWKSIIKNKLGFINEMLSDDYDVRKISEEDSKSFMKLNHLSEYLIDSISYGLYIKDELINLISIKPSYWYDWEIRYCNKIDIKLVNGFDILINHLKELHKGTFVVYDDIRFSNEDFYIKKGFIKIEETKPKYHWWKFRSEDIEYNFKFEEFKNTLEIYDKSLSERENMFNNDYRILWDCGYNVLILE